MIFAGIDPGLSGGIGLVDQDGALVLAVSLPVMGEGSRRQLDGAALAKISRTSERLTRFLKNRSVPRLLPATTKSVRIRAS